MKKIYFFFVMLFAMNGASAQLLQWNTFGNLGTETTEPSAFNNTNLAAANLTQGTITAAANGNRFGGNNWFNIGNTAGGNTLAEAVAGNDYIQFIVTPNAGFTFTPTSFVFVWDRSATGPPNVTLRSSVDGYIADLGTVSGIVSGAFVANTITISGLANISTATTFRLYGYGASATTGTGGFDIGSNVVNVQLNGTTAAESPLPVSLLSFAGQKEGSVNKLRWTTATEFNNLGFEVQRSVDGINYTAIGFVNSLAPGGSNSELNYSFTDNNPVSNRQYYRLRQVDLDNRSKLSNIVLIKGEKPVVLTIDGLFPNPASNTVNVIVATPNRSTVTLVVTDISGRIILQKVVNVETGSNTIPVGISQLSKGSYLVKLVCSDNCESAVGKFVKQ